MQLSERLEIWTGCALGIVTWSRKIVFKILFPKIFSIFFQKKFFSKKILGVSNWEKKHFWCHTTLWQSDLVVEMTWNLDRMCARYSYLKLKKKFKNFFLKKFFLKIFFPKFCFSKIFFWKKNFWKFVLILLFKNHFWPNFFVVDAEINLTSGVQCILVLLNFDNEITYLIDHQKEKFNSVHL